jgi:hypothetical protein
VPTPAHRKIPDFPPPYAVAAPVRSSGPDARENAASARPVSAPAAGRGGAATRPLTPKSAAGAAGVSKTIQKQQQQQQQDPKVLGDARLLKDRVITLKWLRMVPPLRCSPALQCHLLIALSVQVGVPLPISTASKPAAAHEHTSIDPVQATPNIHELFHDGFLLCRLAEILESITIPSIAIRPRTDSAKLANVDKALSVFQVTCHRQPAPPHLSRAAGSVRN